MTTIHFFEWWIILDEALLLAYLFAPRMRGVDSQ